MKHNAEHFLLSKCKNQKFFTKEEQLALISKAKKGCMRSRNLLINSVIRFVIMQAGKYSRRTGIDIEELVSEGVIGTIEAIQKFNLNYDNSFLTYAAFWIRKSFRDYKYLTRQLKMPKNTSMFIDRYSLDLYNGNDTTQYSNAIKKAYHENSVLYLDTPINNPKMNQQGMVFLKDTISNVDDIDHINQIIDKHDSIILIKKLFKKFNARKRKIIAMRLGLSPYERSHTLEEIAILYGQTREAIRLQLLRCFDIIKRQIEERGLLNDVYG